MVLHGWRQRALGTGASLVIMMGGGGMAGAQYHAAESQDATAYPASTPEPRVDVWEADSVPPLQAGRWSGGTALGWLGSTPDDTAFVMHGNAEYFVQEQLSIGPLVQLGFSDDMTLVGISGQGKLYLPVSGTQGRGRVVLQSGVGIVHAEFRRDDTSWLVPLGLGYEWTLASGLNVTAMGLLNFTDLNTGAGTEADVMPGVAVGVRF